MRSLRFTALTASVVVLGAAGAACADVIYLGKRAIHGEILEETADQIVVKVGSGTMTFPKKLVTKVVREEEAATLLGEARALARLLDAKAFDTFDRALAAARKKGDLDLEKKIQAERNAFATKFEKNGSRPSAAPADANESTDDPFLHAKDLEEVRLHVTAFKEGSKDEGIRGASKLMELALKRLAASEPRWAVGCYRLARAIDPRDAKAIYAHERNARLLACGAAVRKGDAKVSRLAIEPLVKDEPRDAHVAYLDGRARETGSDRAGARDAYVRALDGSGVTGASDLDLDWLRELARRRAAGQALTPGSAGVGPSWRRADSAHFIVIHELGDDFTDAEVKVVEEARASSLLRLEMSEGDVPRLGKLPLFIFKSKESYRSGGGIAWAAGHAGTLTLEDGEARAIYTYPGRRSDVATMQHEIAHVLVGEAFPDLLLPRWAVEGVACHAEPDTTRQWRQRACAQALKLGRLPALGEFLGRATPDAPDDAAVATFYALASVSFGKLVERTGSVKGALQLASRIARRGVEAGLRELGVEAAALEKEIHAELGKLPE